MMESELIATLYLSLRQSKMDRYRFRNVYTENIFITNTGMEFIIYFDDDDLAEQDDDDNEYDVIYLMTLKEYKYLIYTTMYPRKLLIILVIPSNLF